MSQTYSTIDDVQQPEISLVNRTPSEADPPPLFSPELISIQAGTSPTFEEQVRRLLGWAGRRCCLESFAPSIQVLWNRRFTAMLGRATLSCSKIELSFKLWPFLQEDVQREVLIHEACHLFVYKRFSVAAPHGKQWVEMMQKCGYSTPSATLPCPNQTAAKQYLVYCRCGSFFVTPQQIGKKKHDKLLFCPICKSEVRSEPYAG